MDLSSVYKTWMHQWLAKEELDIILSVIEVVPHFLVFIVEFPDFGAAVTRSCHQKVVICGPVHVMNQVMMPRCDDFEVSVFRFDIKDLDNSPA